MATKGLRGESLGSRLFAQWLQNNKKGATQKSVGQALGVGQPAVANWALGIYKPQPALRPKIRELTGIRDDAWEMQ